MTVEKPTTEPKPGSVEWRLAALEVKIELMQRVLDEIIEALREKK